MIIKLSREQYRELIKLIAIGEYVVNSIKLENEEYEFGDIEQLIYSYAADYKSDDIVQYSEDEEMYLPSEEFENDVITYVDKFLEMNNNDFIGFN